MRYFCASLTRIANLASAEISLRTLPRSEWASGDYVVGRVDGSPGRRGKIELATGRMTEVVDQDLVVGALGVRTATLEVVGDWRAIDDSLRFQALSSAGLFGQMTSMSGLLPPLVEMDYQGHVFIQNQQARMRDFVVPVPHRRLTCPVILLIGTSMSAGKTTAARVVIRQLAQQGRRVVGAKLTGTGRYRDTLAMWDAGAHRVFDFVDVGLPSTVCDKDEFRNALDMLLSQIAAVDPDVVVAEIGASPLEPYNGDVAVERLHDLIRFTILCASDPFAVVGVMNAYHRRPDLIAGVATSTEAGIALINKLTGLPAVNLFGPEAQQQLDELLQAALGGI